MPGDDRHHDRSPGGPTIASYISTCWSTLKTIGASFRARQDCSGRGRIVVLSPAHQSSTVRSIKIGHFRRISSDPWRVRTQGLPLAAAGYA
jgi:hypothetical protein